jgi:hypothetical protein
MSVLLFVVGGIAAAVGLVLTGLSVSVAESARAGVFLSSGVTILTGGLILIGLGAIVVELRRVAQALSRPGVRIAAAGPAQPAMPARARPEPAERIPYPQRQQRNGVPSEAQPGEAVSGAAERLAPAPPPERLRKSFPSLTRPDAAAPEAAASSDELHAPPEPAMQPEAHAEAAATRAPAVQAPGPAPVAGSPSEAPPRAGEVALPLIRADTFDSFWPARRARPQAAEPPAAAPAPAVPEPPVAAAPQGADEAAQAAAAVPAPAVSIVKSGVVDGMAYTLYSDGSIEAQLAQGTIRFRSINELRMHLENAA